MPEEAEIQTKWKLFLLIALSTSPSSIKLSTKSWCNNGRITTSFFIHFFLFVLRWSSRMKNKAIYILAKLRMLTLCGLQSTTFLRTYFTVNAKAAKPKMTKTLVRALPKKPWLWGIMGCGLCLGTGNSILGHEDRVIAVSIDCFISSSLCRSSFLMSWTSQTSKFVGLCIAIHHQIYMHTKHEQIYGGRYVGTQDQAYKQCKLNVFSKNQLIHQKLAWGTNWSSLGMPSSRKRKRLSSDWE